jgi:Uma2 family endonuclease
MAVGSVATNPISVEEFEKLRLPENQIWELRNGEVVEVPFVKLIHKWLQRRLYDLLRQAFPKADVLVEYPFRIKETNDMRLADVGLTTRERAQACAELGILEGAPELVVEVLSPSNSAAELRRDRRVFFAHGTLIFPVVDAEDSTIEVYRKQEKSVSILSVDDVLTLSLFGDEKTIPVAAIFAGITTPEAR